MRPAEQRPAREDFQPRKSAGYRETRAPVDNIEVDDASEQETLQRITVRQHRSNASSRPRLDAVCPSHSRIREVCLLRISSGARSHPHAPSFGRFGQRRGGATAADMAGFECSPAWLASVRATAQPAAADSAASHAQPRVCIRKAAQESGVAKRGAGVHDISPGPEKAAERSATVPRGPNPNPNPNHNPNHNPDPNPNPNHNPNPDPNPNPNPNRTRTRTRTRTVTVAVAVTVTVTRCPMLRRHPTRRRRAHPPRRSPSQLLTAQPTARHPL